MWTLNAWATTKADWKMVGYGEDETINTKEKCVDQCVEKRKNMPGITNVNYLNNFNEDTQTKLEPKFNIKYACFCMSIEKKYVEKIEKQTTDEKPKEKYATCVLEVAGTLFFKAFIH